MDVVFRADASTTIGQGHVMRCLTLADALRARGQRCAFVCREHPGHLAALITARGFPVSLLPLRAVGDNATQYAQWLGAPAADDAAETRDAIATWGCAERLVVDHYAIDAEWEAAVRGTIRQILVIDDLADRRHDCDLLLDQNLVSRMWERYDGLVPAGAGLLLGPRFALLGPRYATLHERVPMRAGAVRRILIYFGGADTANLTGRTLSALRSLGRDVDIDVVISSRHAEAAALRAIAATDSRVAIHSDLPTLGPLIAAADLAVGASGSTSWERLCLGLPSVVVTLADNQRAIAEGLHDANAARWIGDADVSEETIRDAVAEIVDRGIDPSWSARCAALVDGRGAERVCAMMLDADAPARVRPTIRSDLSAMPSRTADALRASLRDVEGCRLYSAVVGENVTAIVECRSSGTAWRFAVHPSPAFPAATRVREAEARALLALRAEEAGVLSLEGAGAGLRLSVCSDAESWINDTVAQMALEWRERGHQVAWVHDGALLPAGDICFFLSYGRIVGKEILARHAHNLVVHASDLPRGRGWSPLTWQIIEGKNRIPVTLFEAAESVDSGAIYRQVEIAYEGGELVEELRTGVADATHALCAAFVAGYPDILASARPQDGEPTFYARRRAVDSRLDVNRPLGEQFPLLRTVDNERYPAWCEIDGRRYAIKIEHLDGAPLPAPAINSKN